MIYIDTKGHMVADSISELCMGAWMIGLKREWIQTPETHLHYDLTTKRKVEKALSELSHITIVDSRVILEKSKLLTEEWIEKGYKI